MELIREPKAMMQKAPLNLTHICIAISKKGF